MSRRCPTLIAKCGISPLSPRCPTPTARGAGQSSRGTSCHMVARRPTPDKPRDAMFYGVAPRRRLLHLIQPCTGCSSPGRSAPEGIDAGRGFRYPVTVGMGGVDSERRERQAAPMQSAVRWALLGLIIERPSYAYELAQRFERTYEGALSLSSVSHAYAALGTLKDRELIEELPGTRTGRQPKPHYRATAKGIEEYHEWLIGRVAEERRRQRVFVLQLTALTRDPDRAIKIVGELRTGVPRRDLHDHHLKWRGERARRGPGSPNPADRRGEAAGGRRQDRVGSLRAQRAQGAHQRRRGQAG